MSDELTTSTADIVSAFVSHNSIRPEDMVDLLRKVHQSLADVLYGKPEPVEEAIVPAVPIKKSITHDAVFCLVCGTGHKTLKRHLRSSHDLDPAAYREMYGLKSDYSLTAPSYSETRSGLAMKLGLGRKPKEMEAEPVVEPSKPAKATKTEATNAKAEPVRPVRPHSKAEQTRRKSKASTKGQEDAESAPEAA